MRNRFCLSLFAASAIAFSASAAPSANASEKFDKAIKQVDIGGEMLFYQNTDGIQNFFNKFVPGLLQSALKDNQAAPLIIQGWNSFYKMINLSAFEACAASSRQIENDLYVMKSFLLFDRQAKSLLFSPEIVNTPLYWQNFPANTIFAVKVRINLANFWKVIVNELQNSPDPTFQALLMQIAMLKQSGMDVAAIISSVDGYLELIVAGNNIKKTAIKLEIPDKTGALSAVIKPLISQEKLNIPDFPLEFKVSYAPGKVIFCSNERVFSGKTAKLGNLPIFKKFASQLPAQGNGVVVFNLSPNLISQIKSVLAAESQLSILCKFLSPMALLGIQSSEPTGEKTVTASNFSITQAYQSGSMIMPAAAVLLPALNSAREKARIANCLNSMKQFALACSMYADSNNDVYPESIEKLLEKKFINNDICDNIIFLAPNLKYTGLTSAATYPIAICDRFNHKSDKICVAFADGHVVSIPIPENADEKEIIGILNRQYHFSPAVLNTLLKALSGEK